MHANATNKLRLLTPKYDTEKVWDSCNVTAASDLNTAALIFPGVSLWYCKHYELHGDSSPNFLSGGEIVHKPIHYAN